MVMEVTCDVKEITNRIYVQRRLRQGTVPAFMFRPSNYSLVDNFR